MVQPQCSLAKTPRLHLRLGLRARKLSYRLRAYHLNSNIFISLKELSSCNFLLIQSLEVIRRHYLEDQSSIARCELHSLHEANATSPLSWWQSDVASLEHPQPDCNSVSSALHNFPHLYSVTISSLSRASSL